MAVPSCLPDRSGGETQQALPASLARALAWLKPRLDEPVVLEALAAVAGVRPRTLEAHFRQYLGLPPLAWIRRERLARVRRQLLAGDGSVTEIATANGFHQLGRFAVHYRRQFGEMPSQTLKLRHVTPVHRPERDEALRLSWRALAAAFAVGPASCRAALADVGRACELAPGEALPKAIAAWCRAQRVAHHFADRDTPGQDRAEALRLAREAASLAPADALVLSLSSGALTLLRRLDEADRLIERSLEMEPWSPWAWVRRGWLSAYAGEHDRALQELQTTLRLMPFEPLRHLSFIGIGCVHFDAGRYDSAAGWLRDGIAAGPQSFWAERVLVAATAHAGARGEASRTARRLLRKDAGLTVAVAREAWPFRPAFMQRLGDGLAMAGVPAV